MTSLKRFVELETKKKEIDAELKRVNKELDELESALIPDFVLDGVQSMNVDGRTVYLARDIYAGVAEGATKDSVIDALKANDETCAFIAEGYNANTLKAWVREKAKPAEEACVKAGLPFDEDAIRAALPEEFRNVLKVSIVPCLRSRK
jgi:hypothetical protein